MQIGPYVLIRELACGGMAQVWLAHRVWPDGMRRSCGIKLPRRSAVADEGLLRQFLEERRLAVLLRHNNIVSAFDAGVHEGLPYLVMDYIPGRDLGQLARAAARRGAGWELETAIHVVREIGHGLLHAHEYELNGVHQRIIHRDVASKNVMVDGTGGVLLADFGVATSLATQTSRFHTKGTLAFMAPEHYLGQPSPASDVFGLGGIFWELLAGRVFRGGLEGQALISQVVAGTVEPVGRELPSTVQRVLAGMLHPEVSHRLSLREVLRALEEFPHRKLALQEMVSVYFSEESRRTGLSQLHFAASKELLDTLAVAKVAGVSLSDVPRRKGSGPLDELPADFTAIAVDDTAKVDATAVAEALDDDLDDGERGEQGEPVSIGAAEIAGWQPAGDTLRSPLGEGVGSPPPQATVRLAGGIGATGRSEGAEILPTVFVPAPLAMPGVPEQVETQRSVPLDLAATARGGPATWGAPPSSPQAGLGVGPVAGPASLAGRWRWVPFVMVAAMMMVLGLGAGTWLLWPNLTQIDGRGGGVALDAAVVFGKPRTATTSAPERVEPVLELATEAASSAEGDSTGVLGEEPEPAVEPESRQEQRQAAGSAELPEGPELPPAGQDPQPSAAPPKVAKPKPRPPKPVPKLEFVVRRGFVAFAELRVGSGKAQVVPGQGTLTLRVAPGTYTLRYRTKPEGDWESLRYTFSSNMKYAGNIESSEFRINAISHKAR
jgi:eukaryotic-like serine/threonine-protein kinase